MHTLEFLLDICRWRCPKLRYISQISIQTQVQDRDLQNSGPISVEVLRRWRGTCLCFRIKHYISPFHMHPTIFKLQFLEIQRRVSQDVVLSVLLFFCIIGEFFVLALTPDFHTCVGNRSSECCVRLGGITAQTTDPTSAVGNEHVCLKQHQYSYVIGSHVMWWWI